MLEVFFGTLLILVVMFVVMAVRGRFVANRLEPKPKTPGNAVAPEAERTEN